MYSLLQTDDIMQRVGSLSTVPQLLLALGADPEEVVSGTGIDLATLRNPENVISFLSMGRLLKASATATGCEHFGLLVGKSSTLATLGLLGRLMQNAPTVGQAFRDLVDNQHRDVRGAMPCLVVHNHTAVLEHAIYQSGIEGSSQIYDEAMAHLFNIVVELSGMRPQEVSFPCAKPVDAAPYHDYFRTAIRFDNNQAIITFPAAILNLPVNCANPVRRRILEKTIVVHQSTIQPCLKDQVLRHMRVSVASRGSALDDIARCLVMHPRTLNRRLREEGTSFRELRNECRLEVARQLLQNTALSITQIGLTLDYADSAVFSHAFRRLSGSPPSVWRTRLH